MDGERLRLRAVYERNVAALADEFDPFLASDDLGEAARAIANDSSAVDGSPRPRDAVGDALRLAWLRARARAYLGLPAPRPTGTLGRRRDLQRVVVQRGGDAARIAESALGLTSAA